MEVLEEYRLDGKSLSRKVDRMVVMVEKVVILFL
jgi:hypothetical protein